MIWRLVIIFSVYNVQSLTRLHVYTPFQKLYLDSTLIKKKSYRGNINECRQWGLDKCFLFEIYRLAIGVYIQYLNNNFIITYF